MCLLSAFREGSLRWASLPHRILFCQVMFRWLIGCIMCNRMFQTSRTSDCTKGHNKGTTTCFGTQKGTNKWRTSLLRVCIGSTKTTQYVLDLLLRFPFSGPVNSEWREENMTLGASPCPGEGTPRKWESARVEPPSERQVSRARRNKSVTSVEMLHCTQASKLAQIIIADVYFSVEIHKLNIFADPPSSQRWHIKPLHFYHTESNIRNVSARPAFSCFNSASKQIPVYIYIYIYIHTHIYIIHL